MATAESYLPPYISLPPIREIGREIGGYVLRAASQVRISHTDHSRAVESLATSLKDTGTIQELHTYYLPPSTRSDDLRIRQIATVRQPNTGHTHQVLMTAPFGSQGKHIPGVCTVPGITQVPTRGNSLLAHKTFADADPYGRTTSIHTDGMGDYDKLYAWQALHRPFSAMAQSRLDITRELYGDAPVHLVAFSMGTALLVKMLNQHNRTTDNTANVADATFISPAIVTPENTWRVMLREFLPQAYHDELDAAEDARFTRVALAAKFLRTLKLPVVGNAVELQRGTEMSEFLSSTAHVPSLIIYGGDDKLAQPDLFAAAQSENPNTVAVLRKEGRGHSVSDTAYAHEIVSDMYSWSKIGPSSNSARSLVAA